MDTRIKGCPVTWRSISALNCRSVHDYGLSFVFFGSIYRVLCREGI